MVALDQLDDILRELRAAREARGLSLSELTTLTGMDRSALSKLETGQRPNPTIDTLIRYAQAVGKRIVVSLAEG
jgi:transcriptional regulator with XRE-family HTH domain